MWQTTLQNYILYQLAKAVVRKHSNLFWLQMQGIDIWFGPTKSASRHWGDEVASYIREHLLYKTVWIFPMASQISPDEIISDIFHYYKVIDPPASLTEIFIYLHCDDVLAKRQSVANSHFACPLLTNRWAQSLQISHFYLSFFRLTWTEQSIRNIRSFTRSPISLPQALTRSRSSNFAGSGQW